MTKLREAEPEGFEQFWSIWRPHRRHTDGRGDARNTYRKHILNGALPQDIIDGATGFFRFMPEKDRPYVPLAASWLNKEAYADWCEQERAYQKRMAERENGDTVVKMIRPARKTAFLEMWDRQQAEREAAQ